MPLIKPSALGGGWSDQIADELAERLVGQQRVVEPGGDLLPAAVDVAGPFIVVPQQVVPERQPVLGVVDVPCQQ